METSSTQQYLFLIWAMYPDILYCLYNFTFYSTPKYNPGLDSKTEKKSVKEHMEAK